MLLDYLYDFTKRVQPLLDINTELEDVRTEFEPKFNSGEFQGWPKETGGALTHTGAHLDLSAFSSSEEIASLGLDRYSSNKIRKAQFEHLNNEHHLPKFEQSVIMNVIQIS